MIHRRGITHHSSHARWRAVLSMMSHLIAHRIMDTATIAAAVTMNTIMVLWLVGTPEP